MNKGSNFMAKKCKKCFMLALTIVLAGCGIKSDKDNLLKGKDTDERIVMCLEKTYPEHQFKTIESFDMKNNQGIYSDENGIKFRVTNLTFNNRYHFGCRDEYLFTLLVQQNYFESAKKILKEYDLSIVEEELGISTQIELKDDTDISIIAQMIHEVLNCVDIPKVIFPKEQGFSTGQVNYYSVPKWDIVRCDFAGFCLFTERALTGKCKKLSLSGELASRSDG